MRKKKGEDWETFLTRIGEHIKEHQDEYFMRWEVNLTDEDLEKFKEQTLYPMLMDLVRWWETVTSTEKTCSPNHYLMPFGVFNPLCFGTGGPYFNYLATGSERELIEVENYFPELEEDHASSKEVSNTTETPSEEKAEE